MRDALVTVLCCTARWPPRAPALPASNLLPLAMPPPGVIARRRTMTSVTVRTILLTVALLVAIAASAAADPFDTCRSTCAETCSQSFVPRWTSERRVMRMTATTDTSLILIDATTGDDASCAPLVLTAITPADAIVLSCRTLAHAVSLVDGPGYWLLLRPGAHFASSLAGTHSQLTISSEAPPVPAGSNFVIPSASTSGAVIWNCEGASQCIQLASDATDITFRGLEFVNATGHAIVQTEDLASLVPGSILMVSGCTFTGLGGALKKAGGSVLFADSIVQRCRLFPNSTDFYAPDGLVQIDDAHLTVLRSTFNENVKNGTYRRLGGCVSVNSFKSQKTISILDTVFSKNVLFSKYDYTNKDLLYSQTGAGIGCNINATYAEVIVNNTQFLGNAVYATATGLTLNVISNPLDPSYVVRLTLSHSLFAYNTQGNPNPENPSFFLASGGLLAVTASAPYLPVLETVFSTGPYVTVTNTIFRNNDVYKCSGIVLNHVRRLELASVEFVNLRSRNSATALSTYNAPTLYTAEPWSMVDTNFRNCTSQSPIADSQSIVRFQNCPVLLTVSRCNFIGNSALGRGAAFAFAATSLVVTIIGSLRISDSTFTQNNAYQGAGMILQGIIAVIERCTFTENSAQSGAGLLLVSARADVIDCTFLHNVAYDRGVSVQEMQVALSQVIEGAAILITAGSVSLRDSIFDSNSAVPAGGLAECVDYDTGASVLTSSYLGGAVATHDSGLDITGCTFKNHTACSGGTVYITGAGTSSMYNEIIGSYAYRGGAYAIEKGLRTAITDHDITDTSSVTNGGCIVAIATTQLEVISNYITNSRSLTDDGGVFWIELIALITYNVFDTIQAPTGGGAILYRTLAGSSFLRAGGDAVADLMDPILGNELLSEPVSLYGPIQASNVVQIQASVKSLVAYPGQLVSNLSVEARDNYNQTVIGSRGLVIQVDIVAIGASNSSVPRPTMTGTILQQLTTVQVAAEFVDLIVQAVPGNYELVFSLVAKAVQVTRVALVIVDTCPGGMHYSASERICRDCGAELLVHDVALDLCLPCPAGWEVATIGAERACRVCPAGETSGRGGSCTPCGSNTYQPAPGLPCQSCVADGMEGLLCANALPEVESGWFAFSTTLEDGSVWLQTTKCPDGFCAGSVVQEKWIDPITLVNRSAISSAPSFSSAVTRFDQCKYPRLSEEYNLLCGDCAPGYIPWGDSCTKCEKANGGMVFLLLVLSLVLVLFLLRSATLSSQAGHSVIVLYFVQTAMLEVGSVSNLLGWLNIALFSPNSLGQCIAPLTVYDQTAFQILMPLILFAELVCVGFVHWALMLYFRGADAALRRVSLAAGSSVPSVLKARCIRFICEFSVDLYFSASLALLLFTYTQVTVACLSYLACVDVGGVSVVFTQPSMRCASDEYKRYLALVIIALVTCVVGLPVGVLVFLYRNYFLVTAAHRHMRREAARELKEATNGAGLGAAGASAELEPEVEEPTNSAVLHFLKRYAPLFSMYSKRAWFWQVLVLVRRTILVAFSVSLVRSPGTKFLAYSLTHLVSLQLQLYFQPFVVSFFNRAEVVAHFLLILLSQSLTAVLPPYTQSTEIYLFVLVVPPVILYAILAGCLRWSTAREAEAVEFDAAIKAHEAREVELESTRHSTSRAALGLADQRPRQLAATSIHSGRLASAVEEEKMSPNPHLLAIAEAESAAHSLPPPPPRQLLSDDEQIEVQL